ncbi:cation diffusion facilitator family transporter [uncultured Nocardioides sp.]|uniref:cation diffusion facilitator family transporter n=1 Tax=uncultured Nocardioides sp. TaxID=198441 RepID=UPI0026176FEF|nr:cation diffusion facilitator family transporter [uncultured Nocardioides sp.]
MGQGHSHAPPDSRRRLAVVLALTVTVLIVEVVGAVVSGSLALLADAAHMLTDVAGLSMALVVAAIVRRPPSDTHTWGLRRAEVLGAAAQATLLLAVGGFVLVEAVRRLDEPAEVTGSAMLVFGVVGLLGNVVGMTILAAGGREHHDLNMRAAYLEVVADALGSVAVIVAAVLVATTGWDRADPVASLVIVALIVPRTLHLLRETTHVLLEATPRGLALADVRARLLAHDHVREVHDLHVSSVATGLPTLTAHLVVDDSCFHDGHLATLLDQLQAALADDFDVAHSTLQFERAGHAAHEHDLHP